MNSNIVALVDVQMDKGYSLAVAKLDRPNCGALIWFEKDPSEYGRPVLVNIGGIERKLGTTVGNIYGYPGAGIPYPTEEDASSHDEYSEKCWKARKQNDLPLREAVRVACDKLGVTELVLHNGDAKWRLADLPSVSLLVLEGWQDRDKEAEAKLLWISC